MGQNEKDNRSEGTVNFTVKNGIVELIQIDTKDDYRAFGHFKSDTYSDIWQSQHNLYQDKQDNQKAISCEVMTQKATDFILKNNDKIKFHIKTDGNEVSYDVFCKTLEKSEAIIHAKRLASHGTHASNGNTGNVKGHANEQIKKDIEIK